MRRALILCCTLAQLALTGPAQAQSISLGFSNGPFGLSIGPSRACVTTTVPAGEPIRISVGFEVASVSCANAACTERRVRICPIRH